MDSKKVDTVYSVLNNIMNTSKHQEENMKIGGTKIGSGGVV